jgi:hypothetical protein
MQGCSLFTSVTCIKIIITRLSLLDCVELTAILQYHTATHNWISCVCRLQTILRKAKLLDLRSNIGSSERDGGYKQWKPSLVCT